MNVIAVEPLLLVTGASGVGKSTIAAPLQRALPQMAVFDSDALLALQRFGPTVEWEAWLHVAHSAAQGGRPTVLCGTVLPEWLSNAPGRDLVGDVHVLLLVCTDEARAQRLGARPSWRQSHSAEFIATHAAFAAALAGRGWAEVDSSERAIEEVVADVARWAQNIEHPRAPGAP